MIQVGAVLWDRGDDPRGNVQHIARHGVTQEEVEEAFEQVMGEDLSRSSGRPVIFGMTRAGRHLLVAYELIDADIAYPITAYDVPMKKKQ